MKKIRSNIEKIGLSSFLKVFLGLILSCGLSSCFTGIESTKKINLSRDDKKLAELTPEERYMQKIESSPLKDWEEGKPFLITDDKAMMVIVPKEGLVPYAPESLKNRTLLFKGVESKMNMAGQLTVELLFSDGVYIYSYDTGKEFDDAMENFRSDYIPMAIDLEMVDQASKLLMGKKLWSRTNLWYDSNGNRIDGKKYVEVIISEVTPGNMIFPLFVKFISENNEEAAVFMNFGNADTESRSFHNIFSLNDIRKHYPGIDKETWEYISQGKVKEGMTKEECKLSIGNPNDIKSGHDYSQTLDIWGYDNGRVLWFEDGRLVKIRQ